MGKRGTKAIPISSNYRKMHVYYVSTESTQKSEHRIVLYAYNLLFRVMQLKKYVLKRKEDGGIRRSFSNQETE